MNNVTMNDAITESVRTNNLEKKQKYDNSETASNITYPCLLFPKHVAGRPAPILYWGTVALKEYNDDGNKDNTDGYGFPIN